MNIIPPSTFCRSLCSCETFCSVGQLMGSTKYSILVPVSTIQGRAFFFFNYLTSHHSAVHIGPPPSCDASPSHQPNPTDRIHATWGRPTRVDKKSYGTPTPQGMHGGDPRAGRKRTRPATPRQQQNEDAPRAGNGRTKMCSLELISCN